MSDLILHKGAHVVTPAELERVPVPPPTETWFPLGHATVLQCVRSTIQEAGFTVRREQLSLSRGHGRFFGTLDLDSALCSGVSLCVGVRNSIDKSLPISFCAGSRVFVCDNLSFNSEIVVARKHTRFGETRFHEAICKAVQSLNQFRESESARIELLARSAIPDMAAESLMLRAYDQGIVSYRQLPQLIRDGASRATRSSGRARSGRSGMRSRLSRPSCNDPTLSGSAPRPSPSRRCSQLRPLHRQRKHRPSSQREQHHSVPFTLLRSRQRSDTPHACCMGPFLRACSVARPSVLCHAPALVPSRDEEPV